MMEMANNWISSANRRNNFMTILGGYRGRALLALAACLICLSGWLQAEEAPSDEATHNAPPQLLIGTRHAPPFSYQDAEGNWRGLSIQLLDELSSVIGFTYRLQAFDSMSKLLDAASQGDVDMAAAAITITPSREARMDFSHPFHFTGLGIAVPYREPRSSWLIALGALFSTEFLVPIFFLSLLLTGIGIAIWLAERRRNPQFQEDPLTGIGAGFWWSAVTMTTVGYGDKAPITLPGRLIALVWMFAALILIASVTAQITSALTISAFQQGITGPDDLVRSRVGVVEATTANQWAESEGLRRQSYANLEQALAALAIGEVGAVVHDHPLLTHQVRQLPAGSLMMVDGTFERQDYGIAMELGSPLRKDINQALIDLVTSARWSEWLGRYGLR
ncbi:MAG: ABC transporter substrate-binding protein [Planctomycetota bacterium]|nr:MAG: ABC transporter substrate-binding protein [Planctomycetota bacterium]